MLSKNHIYLIATVLSVFFSVHISPCHGSGREDLYDPDGYLYDITTGSGTNIGTGTDDAYDSAYLLRINGVTYNTGHLLLSGRNIICGVEVLSGLQVKRKIYVPATKDGTLGNFGRWYDSLYNPSSSPIVVSVEYSSNLGSDSSTVVTGTSDGDTSIETSDQWVATDDSWDGTEDPSLAHIMHLEDAIEPVDSAVLSGGGYGNDRLIWRYDNVVVNPGQTIAFLTFAVQEKNRASSFDEANGIVNSLVSADLDSVALRGLTVDEYLSLVNLRPVPPDDLQITPSEDFVSTGNEGGPFDPLSTDYVLYNAGSAPFNWSVEPNVPWLDVNTSTGNLPADTDATVTISINAHANILPQGEHVGPVSFTNLTSGVVQKRFVRLMIGIRRVLVYTQYADTSIGGEYDNTMKAVDSAGTFFSVTVMTDSNQLSSMLPMHQILLIPEQERATLGELFGIGTEWAPILQDFITQGGAIVHCDYDQKYGILTGSGLMNITTSSDFSRQDVNVVAPDNPITWQVDSPYTASRYSSYYYTNDGLAVVERPGYGPVVIHKMIGRGHVVLIGHDYYDSNPEQDKIVGNAVLNLPFLKDDLWVSPIQGLDFWGNQGGPFTPASRNYTVANVGENSFEWTATVTQPWLSVEPNSGTLEPQDSPTGGDSQTITVSITDEANALRPGDYNDIITFTDVNSGYTEIRVVRLQTTPRPQEIDVLDTIGAIDDLDMPFGDVIVRQSSVEEIMIQNTSPDCNLVVYEISTPPVLSRTFFDDFSRTILDPGNWTSTVGTPGIDSAGLDEPSPPYSLRLNGHPSGEDAVQSSVIDLSGKSGAELRYWWQKTGSGEPPDVNDDLIIEYWSGSEWVELERQLGEGPDMDAFSESIVLLPREAHHENFSLRIRSLGDANPTKMYDDWFVDDVSISVPVFRLEGVGELPASIPPLADLTISVISEPTELNEYESSITIRSDDEDEPLVEVALQCIGRPDWLVIVPEEDFEFTGHPGGPFLPSNMPCSLTNTSPDHVNINWTVELIDVPWLDAAPKGGMVKPGESTMVAVFPTSHADTMLPGEHIGRLIFTNETTAAKHKRIVILNVETKPKILVSPESFNVTIPCGQAQIETLTIGNSGDADLEFSLRSREISYTPPATSKTVPEKSETTKDLDWKSLVRLDVPYVEGEVLVRFAPETGPEAADPNATSKSSKDMLLKSLDATVEREYSIVPGLCLVRLPEGTTVEDILTAFDDSNDVLYASPNYEVRAHSIIPNDPMFQELWNMHNTGETGGTADADVDAPEAWEITTGNREVVVAVIDTGVDYRHVDLAANMWVNEAERDGTTGVDDDKNGFVDDIYGYDFHNYDGDPIDDDGHGSHVAGTIGAVGNNNIGVTGVCWDVKIMAVKFLDENGTGSTADGISSVQYATLMGVKVLNNSWGGGAYNIALEEAIRAAGNAGIMFVASAGNDYGSNNDSEPVYPASYDLPNVIAVLSTDDEDQLSDHTNVGPMAVDIGAPGGDGDCEIYSCFKNGGYHYGYGTSMAAPHVSGACALIWSVAPSLGHAEVKDIIMRTADPLPSLAGLCVCDGRLNVHKAIIETKVAWIGFAFDTGVAAAGEANDVEVVFDANHPVGTYEGQIIVHSSDEYAPETIVPVTMTVEPVDYYTELFNFEYPFDHNDPNSNDTEWLTLTLIPDGSGSYYRACLTEASGFPVNPAGGTNIPLKDDVRRRV
ncbi:MAG: S8 family serine peptidase [Planctomycetota bacterium]|jgi:subtilisin family serine protease